MPTWTTPQTRTSGSLISSTIWNEELIGNLLYLRDAPVFDTAVILGAATTSGIRLDLEAGRLAVREGDDSGYGGLRIGRECRLNGGTDEYTTVHLLNTAGVEVQLAANGNSEGNLRTVSNHPLTLLTNNTEHLRLTTTGDVAINATAKLYLDGSSATGDTYLQESSANVFKLTTGGSESFLANSSGIYRTTWPTTASAANAYVTDGGNLSRSTSSIRYKHDIATLDAADARAAVLAMRPVTYRGTTDVDQRRYVGFLAEDMATIAPLLATYDDGGEQGTPNYVTYDRITAYLVAVVQQQQTVLDALTSARSTTATGA